VDDDGTYALPSMGSVTNVPGVGTSTTLRMFDRGTLLTLVTTWSELAVVPPLTVMIEIRPPRSIAA
jgi:hypothetical protein